MKNSRLTLHQRGVTLIELMISLILGVFIIGSVIQVFTHSKKTYRMQENLSRLQENGRFAMDFITRDIRQVDFWGCLTGAEGVTNNLVFDRDDADDVIEFGFEGVIGINNDTDSGNAIINGTDAITLRGIGDATEITATPASDTANILVATPNDFSSGDILFVGDCAKGDIFQVSSDPSSSGMVAHITGTGTPGNLNPPTCSAAGNAHCLSKPYEDDASVYQVFSVAYSIRDGAGGQRSLFRQTNGNPAIEMVEGIEDLQILYGEDGNNDGTADFYIPYTTDLNLDGTPVLDREQIVSIRIDLLAVTPGDNLVTEYVDYTFNGGTVTSGDYRLRRAYSTTIAVRNRLR